MWIYQQVWKTEALWECFAKCREFCICMGPVSDEEALCRWQGISSNITTRVQHLNGDRRVIRKVLDETLQVFSPSGRGGQILVKHGIILGSGKEWTQALEASCRPPASPLVSSPSVKTNDISWTHTGLRGKERERERERERVNGNVSKHAEKKYLLFRWTWRNLWTFFLWSVCSRGRPNRRVLRTCLVLSRMDFKKIGTGLRSVIVFRNALSGKAFAVYWSLIALKDTQSFDTHLSCHVALYIYSVTKGVILCCQISVRNQNTWLSNVIMELYKKICGMC